MVESIIPIHHNYNCNCHYRI